VRTPLDAPKPFTVAASLTASSAGTAATESPQRGQNRTSSEICCWPHLGQYIESLPTRRRSQKLLPGSNATRGAEVRTQRRRPPRACKVQPTAAAGQSRPTRPRSLPPDAARSSGAARAEALERDRAVRYYQAACAATILRLG